jgi:hypothetical protein
MSKDLITQTVQRIEAHMDQVNPYSKDTKEHWLYETGVLRAQLAQCILRDSINWQVLINTLNRIPPKTPL